MYPSIETAQELHDLCGGDPAELQLYCHHMYTEIESGSTDKMSLQPRVFRRVMREYQETARQSDDQVFTAIENLPDSLLFESRWLRRERISCEQNVEIECLRAELRSGEPLNEGAAATVTATVRDSYDALRAAGVIASADRLELTGGAVAAGYWKSYVNVERGERWFWNKRSYTELLTNAVVVALRQATDAVAIRTPAPANDMDAVTALDRLRRGGRVAEVAAGDVYPVVQVAIEGATQNLSAVADVQLTVGVGGSSTVLGLSYLVLADGSQVRAKVESWIESHRDLLQRHNASLQVTDCLQAQRGQRRTQQSAWRRNSAVRVGRNGERFAACQVYAPDMKQPRADGQQHETPLRDGAAARVPACLASRSRCVNSPRNRFSRDFRSAFVT